jgi:hypothetical protein
MTSSISFNVSSAVELAGPTGARSKVIKEEHAEVPAADGSKSREILVQQSVEVTRMQLHAQSPEWAAPCWKNACKQVRMRICYSITLKHICPALAGSCSVLHWFI